MGRCAVVFLIFVALAGRGFSETKPLTEVRLALTAGSSNVGYAPSYVAEKLGYFAKEGLTVKPVDFRGGGDTIRGMLGSGIHLGVPSLAGLVQAIYQGMPLKAVAVSFSAAAISWLARADSPIRRLAEIKGKKVGYSRPGSNSYYEVLESLKSVGLTQEDVQLVPIGDPVASWNAVKSGIIDVGFSMEPISSKAVESKEGKVIWNVDDVIPHWIEGSLATTDEMIQKQPDLIRRFITAYLRGVDYVRDHPEESARIWAEMVGFPDVPLAVRSMKNYPSRAWSAKFDLKALAEITKAIRVLKLVEGEVDWKRVIDQSFLPKELRVELP
jgi:NitT/TauT family transport system substrate-binding protein